MNSILIVDDEPKIREMLRRMLEPEGYQLREAPHAEAALEALQQQSADAVLCDVQMPGHDGLWLVARIRERHPDVPVVLVTAVSTVPPVVSLREGVTGYLVKPFQKDRVLAAVKEAIQWRQSQAQAPTARANKDEEIDRWLKGKLGGR